MKKINIHPGAKALIFDLDGTLADTMGLHTHAWELTGEIVGKPITAEMVTRLNGTPTYEVVLELNKLYGWDLDPESVTKIKNQNT